MSVKRWTDIKKGKLSDEQAARADARGRQLVLEMNLREMREALGKTQVDLAEAAKMSQGQLSETERRADILLSTLRRYVEALGGEVEVIANFGDRRVRLKGV